MKNCTNLDPSICRECENLVSRLLHRNYYSSLVIVGVYIKKLLAKLFDHLRNLEHEFIITILCYDLNPHRFSIRDLRSSIKAATHRYTYSWKSVGEWEP
jgi:hypothetical protein